MDDIKPPERLGRFEILRPLGEGGMGQVYLAKDPAIGREVAIKVINTEIMKGGKGRERFIHEAQAAGSLSHPNLITIHEFGEDEGVLFLVMEYLPGQDLTVFLKRHALAQEEALEICAQICDGLACAHERGIFHRDVKPSNVRVRREAGRLLAKLMDFGVARMPGSKLTATGDVVGTYAYMAPEYLRGGEPGVQSDLYPVGMMLCEALTGDLPQMGPTLPQGSAAKQRQEAKPQHADLSPVVWTLLDKALSPDPAHRFPSALAFSQALRAAIPLLGAPAAPAPAPSPSGAAARPLTPGARPMTIVRTAEPEPAKLWPWFLAIAAVAAGIVVWQLREKPSSNGQNTAAASAAQAPAQTQAIQPPPPPQRPSPSQGQVQGQIQGQAPAGVQRPPDLGPPPSSSARPPSTDDTRREASRSDADFVRAQAEAFATAYHKERWSDMGTVLDDLKAKGIDGWRFGAEDSVRQVMQGERNARRMPKDMMDRIRSYLPPPPGGDQGGGPPNGGQPPQGPH